jgi:sugar phosphate isomerase/epimerase
MYLAANTFVYEVGKVPWPKMFDSMGRFGFKYVDLAAYEICDPGRMNKAELKDFVRSFKDHGFLSSQLIMANTEHLASPDPKLRSEALEYMKRCAALQRELGGRQVLICWGCGVRVAQIGQEQSWVNTVSAISEFAAWAQASEVLVDLEMDPHVYFVINSMEKMTRALEQIDLPNVIPNVDIGHMCITREPPRTLEKLRERIIHVHISETDTFEHTNSIIGSGQADFPAYIAEVERLGIEANCARYGEVPVAGIEMGEPGKFVDDPDRWIRESLTYLARTLPRLKLA